MVPTPGCWAREDMGAAFAGVFWGVLEGCLLADRISIVAVGCDGRRAGEAVKLCGGGSEQTYGAVMESIFLLRMGSDILAESDVGGRVASC